MSGVSGASGAPGERPTVPDSAQQPQQLIHEFDREGIANFKSVTTGEPDQQALDREKLHTWKFNGHDIANFNTQLRFDSRRRTFQAAEKVCQRVQNWHTG